MALIVLIYGLAILVGGIVGHQKAGSAASLICGIVFGTLLIFAAIGMFRKKSWGYFALFLTLILDSFFTYRYIKTGAFLPAGLLALVSLALLLTLALSLKNRSRS